MIKKTSRAPGKNSKGIGETGATALNKTARRIRLNTSSRKIADVSFDLILDLTFNSLNIGTIIATEDELKQTPKINDARTLNPAKIPTKHPVAKGIPKFSIAKYITFLPVLFKTENFVSNPAVNMRKTSPKVAMKSITSPGLTHPKPYGPKKIPAKMTAVTHGM